MTNELHAVGFQVGQRTFALPITTVHEIVRPPQITAVPQSAEYVEGVINLRGRIVPVIDLRRRFGEAVTESTRKNRILVVTIANRLVGLLADSASEVLKITEAEIEPTPKLFGEAEHSYVAGIAKCGGRLVVLLRPDELLRADAPTVI
jgi:purine-binding chemotaxis protein CheW